MPSEENLPNLAIFRKNQAFQRELAKFTVAGSFQKLFLERSIYLSKKNPNSEGFEFFWAVIAFGTFSRWN